MWSPCNSKATSQIGTITLHPAFPVFADPHCREKKASVDTPDQRVTWWVPRHVRCTPTPVESPEIHSTPMFGVPFNNVSFQMFPSNIVAMKLFTRSTLH